MQDLFQDLVGLEVDLATGEVNVSAGSETPFFIEYNTDTPTPAHDGLVAAAALGLSTPRSFGTVDTLEAFVSHASECHALEAISIRDAHGCFRQRFKERLRALVSCA